jgi:uncharacterized membrane protein
MYNAYFIVKNTPILTKGETYGLVKSWLWRGFIDFKAHIYISVIYGLSVFFFTWFLVYILILNDLLWMLLSVLSGSMLVGPLIAVGLYQISRHAHDKSATEIQSPLQIALVGGILMLLLLAWLRSATILFALFYGLKPFPGFWVLLDTLFHTQSGLWLLFVGSAVGGLFAAFSFSITVFALPMLVSKNINAFTAMGRSFSTSIHNFWLVCRWAATITLFTIIGFFSGMILMVFIFPLLGYASWHAYSDVFDIYENLTVS